MLQNERDNIDPKIILFKECWKELLDDDTPVAIKCHPNTRRSYFNLLQWFYGNRQDLQNDVKFIPPDQIKLTSTKPWLCVLVNYANQLHDFDIRCFDPYLAPDRDPVLLAEKIIRSALQEGFNAHYLLHVIALPDVSPAPGTPTPFLFQGFVYTLMQKLRQRMAPRDIDVYARIIGGSRKRGKRYQWSELPASITAKVGAPHNSTGPYGEDSQAHRFLRFTVKARDPYAAVHQAYDDYRLMFNNISITKKRRSPGKSVHCQGTNEGGSPVEIDDDNIVVHDELTLDEFPQPLFPRVLRRPPYQMLKANIEGVRDHFETFGKQCRVFRALADCYSRAVWSVRNNDIEGVFQNLAVAIDLSFREQIDLETEISGPNLFVDLGSQLLALDFPRSFYEWLTRHVSKRLYPGKSGEKPTVDIYETITRDDQWVEACSKKRMPELLRHHRDTLISILNKLDHTLKSKSDQYRVELTILRENRNKWAHTAEKLLEPYYLSIIIEYFRLVLDFSLRIICSTLQLPALPLRLA